MLKNPEHGEMVPSRLRNQVRHLLNRTIETIGEVEQTMIHLISVGEKLGDTFPCLLVDVAYRGRLWFLFHGSSQNRTPSPNVPRKSRPQSGHVTSTPPSGGSWLFGTTMK